MSISVAKGSVICTLESESIRGLLIVYSTFLSILCAFRCGGVVGLYYCVKRCAMLYLYAESGGVGPSPYLDVHGEVDFAMRYAIVFVLFQVSY